MNESKFIVGILCLFGDDHTTECIESVVYKDNVDVLLIDNNAETALKHTINTYEKRLNNVFVIRNDVNMYVNYGMNQVMYNFLTRPEYDYCILLNSDVVMHPDWDIVLRNRLAVDPNESTMPTMIDDKHFSNVNITTEYQEGTVITGGVNGAFTVLNRKQVEVVYPIPESIRIWYGDNFWYSIVRGMGHFTRRAPNLLGYHCASQNVSRVPEAGEIIEQDKIAWANSVEKEMLDRIEKYNSQKK